MITITDEKPGHHLRGSCAIGRTFPHLPPGFASEINALRQLANELEYRLRHAEPVSRGERRRMKDTDELL